MNWRYRSLLLLVIPLISNVGRADNHIIPVQVRIAKRVLPRELIVVTSPNGAVTSVGLASRGGNRNIRQPIEIPEAALNALLKRPNPETGSSDVAVPFGNGTKGFKNANLNHYWLTFEPGTIDTDGEGKLFAKGGGILKPKEVLASVVYYHQEVQAPDAQKIERDVPVEAVRDPFGFDAHFGVQYDAADPEIVPSTKLAVREYAVPKRARPIRYLLVAPTHLIESGRAAPINHVPAASTIYMADEDYPTLVRQAQERDRSASDFSVGFLATEVTRLPPAKGPLSPTEAEEAARRFAHGVPDLSAEFQKARISAPVTRRQWPALPSTVDEPEPEAPVWSPPSAEVSPQYGDTTILEGSQRSASGFLKSIEHAHDRDALILSYRHKIELLDFSHSVTDVLRFLELKGLNAQSQLILKRGVYPHIRSQEGMLKLIASGWAEDDFVADAKVARHLLSLFSGESIGRIFDGSPRFPKINMNTILAALPFLLSEGGKIEPREIEKIIAGAGLDAAKVSEYRDRFYLIAVDNVTDPHRRHELLESWATSDRDALSRHPNLFAGIQPWKCGRAYSLWSKLKKLITRKKI